MVSPQLSSPLNIKRVLQNRVLIIFKVPFFHIRHLDFACLSVLWIPIGKIPPKNVPKDLSTSSCIQLLHLVSTPLKRFPLLQSIVVYFSFLLLWLGLLSWLSVLLRIAALQQPILRDWMAFPGVFSPNSLRKFNILMLIFHSVFGPVKWFRLVWSTNINEM